MYLTVIDSKTGLLDEGVVYSGWKAIKSFAAVNNNKKLGLRAMTVIALTADYESPYRYYPNSDRFARACEEIYGDREALKADNEYIKAAMNSYLELQKNPDLEQDRINREIKTRILEKLSEANMQDDDTQVSKYSKALRDHETSIDAFNKKFNRVEVLAATAVTANGYELTRIENDIRSRKNSKFLNHGDDIENPNKLGLS